jgi:hypothetical protein
VEGGGAVAFSGLADRVLLIIHPPVGQGDHGHRKDDRASQRGDMADIAPQSKAIGASQRRRMNGRVVATAVCGDQTHRPSSQTLLLRYILCSTFLRTLRSGSFEKVQAACRSLRLIQDIGDGLPELRNTTR